MALTAGTRLGPYEIIALLGAGGMGEVYRARDGKLGRDIAIKVLPASFAHDPERLARFEREAKTLAALNHPNIAHIYGFEDSTSVRALIMEIIDGPTLADHVAKGPIPIDEALPIAKQIAEALETAHEQGIIHRDLKPANIKVRDDGTVKVLDFGLAKALDPAAGSDAAVAVANSPTITSPALTERGVILGTAAYMSPEQAKGRPADKRSDVWAFGCVLYEMLTGRRVFGGEDVSDTLAAVLRGEPDWTKLPSATSPALRRLLRRCLEKDRKRRLDSAADLRLDVEELMSVDGSVGESIPTPRPLWVRALPWAPIGVLAVALFATFLAWPRSRTASAPTRMTLSLSRDNSLSVEGGTAISPDGRTVAFVARSAQGSRLYVRQLDEWEPRAVPLTDGATNPFFSPDGRWIAFAFGNILKKVPVSGGTPQIICKTGDQSMLGGYWQSDGTIVFGAWPQVGLWRVSSDGGTPQAITQPTEGTGVWYLWPEPLPDGKGMLFTVQQGGRSSIAVLPSGADKPRILVESGVRPRYLPTGHLAYVADSHLFAVPFDVKRLALLGGATIVVDDMNEVASISDYDVSLNGVLVYLPAGTSAYNIVWKDRRGETTPISAASHRYGSLNLSPDGKRFSVVVNEGPTRNIWTGSVTGGLLTRLTFGNDDTFGLWSRDGTRLFYSAGQNNYNLFWTATDGSGKAERLTQSPHAQNPTSLSPSGDTILLNEIDPSNGSDIWEFSLSTKKSRPLVKTRFSESGAVFSPDGHWIAYQSDESGHVEIYVQAYLGPGVKRRVSVDGGTLAVWSHTGRELFYQTATAMFAVPILDSHDLRVGTPLRLFVKARDTLGGRYTSSDDQRFLMLERAQADQASQLNLVQNWFDELKARVPTK